MDRDTPNIKFPKAIPPVNGKIAEINPKVAKMASEDAAANGVSPLTVMFMAKAKGIAPIRSSVKAGISRCLDQEWD